MRKDFHDTGITGSRLASIQVLDRAMLILEVIAGSGSATLTSIAAEVKLPLSTVSRILDSLGSHGLVERDRDNRTYHLGPRILALGSRVRHRRDLLKIARPILEDLAAASEEDVGLSSLQGTHAAIIDRVEGPQPLKIIDVLAAPVPLYCGAFRKVLLAHQTTDWIEQYLSSTRLVRFTPRTISSKQALRKELQSIRENGYALSFGEKIPDAAGVAAPVFDLRGKIRAAVFIVGPITRITEESVPRLVKVIVAAAEQVTGLLRGEAPEIADHDRERRKAGN